MDASNPCAAPFSLDPHDPSIIARSALYTANLVAAAYPQLAPAALDAAHQCIHQHILTHRWEGDANAEKWQMEQRHNHDPDPATEMDRDVDVGVDVDVDVDGEVAPPPNVCVAGPPMPPPFKHQTAGHRDSGESHVDGIHGGSLRSHRRRRSASPEVECACTKPHHRSIADNQTCQPHSSHSAPARATNNGDDANGNADTSHSDSCFHSTVLKPIPIQCAKGRREQMFYAEVESIRFILRRTLTRVKCNTHICTCTCRSACTCHAALNALNEWMAFFPRYYGTIRLTPPHTLTRTMKPTADAATPVAKPSRRIPSNPSPIASSPESSSPTSLLHLDDLTSSYAHPCVLDIKIGTHSFDPFTIVSEEDGSMNVAELMKLRAKFERERKKCPAQATFGFRICGARIWNGAMANDWDDGQRCDNGGSSASVSVTVPTNDMSVGGVSHVSMSPDGYIVYDKHWGRGIAPDAADDAICQMIWTFLGMTPRYSNHAMKHESLDVDAKDDQAHTMQPNGTSRTPPISPTSTHSVDTSSHVHRARTLLRYFLQRLRQLHRLCLHHPRWRFYASSILMCYEGQKEYWKQRHQAYDHHNNDHDTEQQQQHQQHQQQQQQQQQPSSFRRDEPSDICHFHYHTSYHTHTSSHRSSEASSSFLTHDFSDPDPPLRASIHLIDFAHAYPIECKTPNIDRIMTPCDDDPTQHSPTHHSPLTNNLVCSSHSASVSDPHSSSSNGHGGLSTCPCIDGHTATHHANVDVSVSVSEMSDTSRGHDHLDAASSCRESSHLVDWNYLAGLKSLIRIFERMLQSAM